jgi:RNA polymerase sigma factor for flagellar operon FliA
MTPDYAIAAYASGDAREALILQHLPQVRFIAARVHETLTANVVEDDLISAGILGLIAAVDNYRPESGVKLSTYAEHKIRGAIYDSLRALDWAPRSRRRRWRDIQCAIAAAEQKLGRAPEDTDVAAELGVSVETYHEWLVQAQVMTIGSLEAVIDGRQERQVIHYRDDSDEASPERILERAELERFLTDGINRMPRLEQTVLSLYFIEELTLKEIGEVIGVRTTRVCQLKAQAVLRLRAYVERCWPATGGAVAR